MSCIERTIQISFKHRVYFTRDVFGATNPLLRDLLNSQRSSVVPRVLVVVDESLNSAQRELTRKIESYFSGSPQVRLVCRPVVLEGGERVKNSYFHVSDIQSHIDRYHIDRHSYVIAVGGGALLDLVGLAAATAHRGVRHIRIPTTTLSQNDPAVAVKTGLTPSGQKTLFSTLPVPL